MVQKLVKGVHQFQDTVVASKKEFFEKLGSGQSPSTLFITCSDSRVVPTIITQADPGDLFELQNAGNIVPAYGAGGVGAGATIEYAVAALKVTDIIVCGHSHCGAMTALLHPEHLEGLPAVAGWLKHAESARRIVEENYKHVTNDRDRLMVMIEENVLVQLEHIRTHPTVAAALGRKAVNLHGWVYKVETGEVFEYDPDQGQYLPLKRPTPA